MEQKFLQRNPELQTVERILVAVSTGVDSMVLLRLLEKLSTRTGLKIGVAHVNHQLRKESAKEAIFLKNYCYEHHHEFYEKKWETLPESGIEVKARDFRYTFFAEVMKEAGFPLLLTAHHGDDQIETMLMRFTRGGSLLSHAGMQRRRSFGDGTLFRPLLSFSKQMLVNYALKEEVPYFEDSSNATLRYARNRIRHQVLPVLKEENPKLLEHSQQFQQQLTWAEDGLRGALKENLNNVVYQKQRWRFIQKDLPSEEGLRYYFLAFLFEEIYQETQLVVSQRQLFQLVHLFSNGEAQWSMDLGEKWQFSASYQTYTIAKENVTIQEIYSLNSNETIELSPNEQLVLKKDGSIERNGDYSAVLPTMVRLPLIVRRREPGDRIQLAENLRKKVSRYFIDEKIPRNKREQAWVVTDAGGEVLSVIPFVNSYLSIGNETDRIHYILDYYLYH
ncbi:tRNA lysidine(34) synthetase TilS [Enterococcus sp. AZ072]|uniref:tRNA lysidine(34) synthetase TilS n=1 Tax=unclassified Enterococcus TaxID=2608891 RepID=UPI003D2D06C1